MFICLFCFPSVHSAVVAVSAISIVSRAVPNILFVFYSVRIVGRIVYSYSVE